MKWQPGVVPVVFRCDRARQRRAATAQQRRSQSNLAERRFSRGCLAGSALRRGGMLHLRPDMASLASGSVNFPTRVYDNAPDLIDWLAAEMKATSASTDIARPPQSPTS